MKMNRLTISVLTFAAVAACAFGQVNLSSDPDLHILPVQGNIYMLVGAGGNIAMSIGPDGIILVDSGRSEMAGRIAKVALELETRLYASPVPNSCSGLRCPAAPFGWSSSSLNARLSSPVKAKPIRYIINTSIDADRIGGNAKLSELPTDSKILGVTFPPVGVAPSAYVIAHENVLSRMSVDKGKTTVVPSELWPTDTFRTAKYKLSEFFNGEGVQIMHQPNAHTDGDSMVYFRYSDVIVTGEILDPTRYPVVDLENGGNIRGIIEGLNNILDLAIAEFRSQGGTMIIPGHGRLMDVGDVANYRNMVSIITDRIQDMIQKGMTLAQVNAAKPTMDYDGIYGFPGGSTQPSAGAWTTDMFVEAVYKSLSQKK